MGKIVVVAEKPSVGRDIARVLGAIREGRFIRIEEIREEIIPEETGEYGFRAE